MHPMTVPEAIFLMRVRSPTLGAPNPVEWKVLSSDDIFTGKKVVLFALPWAFTPACSETHLFGFKNNSSGVPVEVSGAETMLGYLHN